MKPANDIWKTPEEYLAARQPETAVHFFCPAVLHNQALKFLDHFPGLTTFAVKANPDPSVISHLLAAGVKAFDVASPKEIALLRRLAPKATLHYNNPARSRREVQFALENGVRSFSVDSLSGLAKLAAAKGAKKIETSVRFKLPLAGAVYDFGSKFGATPEDATALLRSAAELGFTPSLTFHPGTQCTAPQTWQKYIEIAAEIARNAGVRLSRLNVGGGFPAPYTNASLDLCTYFTLIRTTVEAAFGAFAPELICEPGRALVAPAFALAVQVKELRDAQVFLNDGIYGGLSEFPVLKTPRAFRVITPNGHLRLGDTKPYTLFGPTCDSLDVLPGYFDLPATIEEEDYIIFPNMGAYVTGVTTDFNGYGTLETQTVLDLLPKL